jgi:hypothetical protein
MSWLVKSLLQNYLPIHSSVRKEIPITRSNRKRWYTSEIQESPYFLDYDDETYSDLMEVISCVNELKLNGQINDFEFSLIQGVAEGYTYKELADIYSVSKMFVYKRFTRVCNRIAFTLGGKFTNEGLLSYMTNKYSLDEEKQTKLREYLHL